MNSKDYIKLAQLCAAIQEQSDKKHAIIAEVLRREGDINFPIPPQSCAKRFHENSVSFAPLHAALDTREIRVFETLLAHGADFTARNERGETILHLAVANSCLKYANCWKIKGRLRHPFVDCLLLANVNSGNRENPRDRHGISYFHAACMTNNAKAVEFYLNHGVSVDETVDADTTALAGFTPLHLAVRYCSLDAAEILLRRGADARLKSAGGLTALQLLVERNMEIVDWMNMGRRACYDQLIADFEDNERTIELILERNFDDAGLTRFHVACTIYDHARIEQMLVEELADLERAVDANAAMWPGYTALHFAAHFNVETVKLLMKNGADVLRKDARGVTPFELCLRRYEAEDVQYLIANQPAWKYIVFSDNRTRLTELVFAMRSAKGFKAYLERLSNVNMFVPKDSPLWPGCTPLHLATIFPERTRDITDLLANTEYSHGDEGDKQRYYNCSPAREKLYYQRIQVLLSLGADVTAPDSQNSTPLHRAFRLQRESAANAFLRHLPSEIRNRADDEGLSYLHIACAAQRRDLIDKLLDEGNANEPVPASCRWFVRPYFWDTSSYFFNISADSTLLHMAVTCENADLAEMLLRRGADVHARDVNGLTPVHRLFVIRSRNSTARHLFAAADLQERALRPGGLTHLHVASLMGGVEAVARLLDAGADANARIAYEPTAKRNHDETTYLMGNPAFDLYDDASPEPLSFLSAYDGCAPLHLAMENQDAEVARLLVERGADVLARKADGSAPLFAVLEQRYLATADCFVGALRRDGKLRERLARETGVTMLHVASATLDVDWARRLLDEGVDANARAKDDSPIWAGCAPLHLLSTPASPEERDKIGAVMELLLRGGADVTLMNAKLSSPVHRLYSFIESYVENNAHVDALLRAQTDYGVNPTNSKGLTHFHVACARNQVGIVEEFLRRGVDVDHAVDHFHGSFGGYSPLHVAVYKECPETIDLLLRHRARVDAEDRHGNTPLHVAADREDMSRSLIERVIKGGANIHAKNLLGKTLLEILLIKYSDVPAPIVELFLEHGWRVNTFNPVSEEGTLAMAFSVSNNNLRGVDKSAFRALTRAPDVADLDDAGRNAIHNIVSTNQPQHKNSAEDYADAIEILARSGCDYDHQDNLGRTPLHLAVQFRQIEAITGLLQSGADVNVLDASGRPAFAYILQHVHKHLLHDRDIVVNLAVHLRKMVRLGLDVRQVNVEAIVAARKVFSFNVEVRKEFDMSLQELKERKISGTHISLHDFLSETGAVSTYPYTTPQERLAMKELFENQFETVRREFPEVAGFLRLQYGKAHARPPLIDPAIASLRIVLGFELPVLCSDVVLKFLRNEDLRNLITAAD